MAVQRRWFWTRNVTFAEWTLNCAIVFLLCICGVSTSTRNYGVSSRSSTLFPPLEPLPFADQRRLSIGDSFPCFSSQMDILDDVNRHCHCNHWQGHVQLTCSDLSSFEELDESLVTITAVEWHPTADVVDRLVITNSSLGNFNLSVLCERFPKLKDLTLHHNLFYQDVIPLPSKAARCAAEHLDLSSNNLREISPEVLRSFPRLKILRLSENNISSIRPNLFNTNKDLKTIYLKDNPLHCEGLEWFFYWIQSNKVTVEERDQTNCSFYKANGQYFGSATFEALIDHCPPNCTCVQFLAGVKVVCSNKNYRSFPAMLPAATNYLHMENNQIDSLQSLINGSNYMALRFLYLDNNSIDSIDNLERTDFFNDLTALYLTGNRLTKLPAHMIERMLVKYLDQVALGNNPWNCECNAVIPFHNLMMTYKQKFRDIEEIRCNRNDPYYPNQPIHELSKRDLCVSEVYIDPLDVMNVCMVILILLIVAKVLYDYRRLKQTGQMPVGPFNCYSIKSTRNVP